MSSRTGLLARHAAWAMAAAILVIALPSPAAASDDPTVVRTDAGRVRGTATDSYRLFQGIPSPPRQSGHAASSRRPRYRAGRASGTPAAPATAAPNRRPSPGSRPATPRTA